MTKLYCERPCRECPWRRDQPAGRFPPERYRQLRYTVQRGGSGFPMFGCHKSPEGKEFACAGYLLVDGLRNNTVRLAVVRGHIDLRRVGNPENLQLFDSYEDMAYFNGYDMRRDRLVHSHQRGKSKHAKEGGQRQQAPRYD